MGAPRGLSGAECAGSVRRDPQDWPTKDVSVHWADRVRSGRCRLRVDGALAASGEGLGC
jgi:hypothetical protein